MARTTTTATAVVVDLETLGTTPGAVILSIGAVAVGPDGGLGKEFYVEICRQNSILHGLTTAPSTIKWWNDTIAACTDPELRDTYRRVLDTEQSGDGKLLLPDALLRFSNFFNSFEKGTTVWGNGANFDPPILEHAYKIANMPVPWTFRDVRCIRTMCGEFNIPQFTNEAPHHALFDARAEALMLHWVRQNHPA